MRLCLVLLGMASALAACSSPQPAVRATTEAPIVPLVAEEEASVAATGEASSPQTPQPQPGEAREPRSPSPAVRR